MKREDAASVAMQLVQRQVLEWGYDLIPAQLDLLQQYAASLSGYTEANVVGTKDLRSLILNHVLDALSCLLVSSQPRSSQLIDVGSGGGLPGLPVAIARSELCVALLEATEKKATFLRHVQENLRLGNVSVINERAEAAGRQRSARDSYNVATTRALASLPVVVEYCAPFVKEGGLIVAMKGRLEEDELMAGKAAARKLRAELENVVQVRFLPELEQKQRRLVVFRKTGPTPDGYPRRVGLAKKRPLGT